MRVCNTKRAIFYFSRHCTKAPYLMHPCATRVGATGAVTAQVAQTQSEGYVRAKSANSTHTAGQLDRAPSRHNSHSRRTEAHPLYHSSSMGQTQVLDTVLLADRLSLSVVTVSIICPRVFHVPRTRTSVVIPVTRVCTKRVCMNQYDNRGPHEGVGVG
jgi:hypothetical protein